MARMARSAVRECQRLFWVQIRLGLSTAEAAEAVGVALPTAKGWFRKAGGMPPLSLVPPVSTRYLSLAERELIHAGIHRNDSIRQIARDIDRAPTTVMRELAENLHHQAYRPRVDGGRRLTPWNYSPSIAHDRGQRKLARPKVAKLAANEELRVEVQDRLKDKLSPEQIMNRSRLDFPDDLEMRVSHETIYQSIYVQGRGALKRELAKSLRTGRTLRKPHRKPGQKQTRIKDMVMISDRPPEVEDRAVPGHWEGDLITGENNASAIGTLVERKTGFVMLLHLPGRHGAVEVQDQMITVMGRLPEFLRKTVTWDQGIEMAGHKAIRTALDMDIYFCDPHSPWQRGSNENTNGLLRQYFPKGTDLSGYHQDYLDFVANQLNDRPRKRHGWLTPKEVFPELLSDQANPPGVATTG